MKTCGSLLRFTERASQSKKKWGKGGGRYPRFTLPLIKLSFYLFHRGFCVIGSRKRKLCAQNYLGQKPSTTPGQSIIQNISHSVFPFMYNLFCILSQEESSSSVLIKRMGEASCLPPHFKKIETFYNFNTIKKAKKKEEAKSQTSYFPLCISNMASLRKRRIMLAEYIWTGIIIRGFSSAYMATKTQRRWFWKTTDDSNIKQNNPQ